jgi:CubicO group peptidase (beta-lactamase class C family)
MSALLIIEGCAAGLRFRHGRLRHGRRREIHLSALTLGLVELLLLSANASAQTADMDPARLRAITVRMQAFVDQGTAAGFVTVLSRHGQVAQLAAVGYQDLESKKPMRTDTIFQIASMTKPITSVGILILADEGKLALADPVEKHLPEFRGKPITIQHLLTHTSGMPGGGPARKPESTLAEMVFAYSQLPLQFTPGSKWSYSNTGMATLGRIIEAVSKKPYEQFIAERIFRPLAMVDTFYFPPEEKYGRIASIYTDDNGKLKRANIDLYKKGIKYPAPEGGLYSTASDLAKFYQMLLSKGKPVLSKSAVEVMTKVHTGDLTTGFAPGMGYGLGVSIVRNAEGAFRLNSIGTFGHGGAYRTYGWVDPAKDMFGVILFQRTNGGGDVADEINAFMAMAAAAITGE